jgi:hypothetical protein
MSDKKNIIVDIQQLKKDLLPLFEGYPVIQSAYHFGSTAVGHADRKAISTLPFDMRRNYHLNPVLTCVSN